MVVIYYYSDDLLDVDYEKLVLYHEDISVKPFWIIFDDIKQFVAWWNDNKDKIVIVDYCYWDPKEKLK